MAKKREIFDENKYTTQQFSKEKMLNKYLFNQKEN